MDRRRALALVAVLIGLLGAFGAWRRAHRDAVNDARERADERAHASLLASPEPTPTTATTAVDAGVGAFRPPATTVHDRAVRDDIRQRILAAWRESLALPPSPADGGAAFLPMPVLDGGSIDPSYIRARIREDLIPLAESCYNQLLARHPGVGGRAVTEFVVVGDERVGGVVDEVTVDAGDGGLSDPDFSTCLRESTAAVAFRPPPGRGTLRVRYGFNFAPDEDGGGPAR